MLRDYLLDWCQEELDASITGHCGQYCDNKEYCEHDCNRCLDQVHWYPAKPGRADYTCPNLLLTYVLRFTERYSHLITDALEFIDHSIYTRYNILSIGCGGTPDLMAFEENNEKAIYYKGYDRNDCWSTIHNRIEQYAANIGRLGIDLRQEDIFDVVNTGDLSAPQYNVLVFQYVLSHLFNTGQETQTSQLFQALINEVISRRLPGSPFLIIITDVDSVYKGRNRWFTFMDMLEDAGFHGRALAKSAYPNGDLGRERWSRHKYASCFGNISYTFVLNDSEHDGAQLIIELR